MTLELTQDTLKGILANIFDIDTKYITLKQGNWFNAQDLQAIVTNKPLTWVRYRILDDIPITTSGLDEDDDPDNPILKDGTIVSLDENGDPILDGNGDPTYEQVPVLDDDGEPTYEQMQVLVTQMITPVELNFIGARAELCAKSVKNWLNRADVTEQFTTVGAKVMAVDRRATPFDYIQEGMNSTLAYSANFRLARKSLQPTGALKLDNTYSIILEGGINDE
jgi:hypothetical protein